MSREVIQKEIDLTFEELDKLLAEQNRNWEKIKTTSAYLSYLFEILNKN